MKYLKYIITIFLFFITPLILSVTLPSVGSNNIIDLILRLTINALMYLTFIYIFHKEIYNKYKEIKKDKIINIILYLILLSLGFVINKIVLYLLTNIDLDVIIKVDILFKKIPKYMFINTVLLMPFLETSSLRCSLNKLIKNKYIFLILNFIIYYIFLKITYSEINVFILIVNLIISLHYIKDKNIITTTILSMLFNLIIYLVNYL